MNEKGAWATLKRVMGDRWHATRVEDRLQSGIPDVTWGARGVQGWMELKYLEWPKRPTTPVKIGLRPEQAIWLTQRGQVGTYCSILVRVGLHEWFLFNWQDARDLLQPKHQNELFQMSACYWANQIDPDRLLGLITGRNP